MQGCSRKLWNHIAPYCIHHLLDWGEVPAFLTAGYTTDSHRFTQLTSIVCQLHFHKEPKSDKKNNWIQFGGGGMLNWFRSAKCCWLKITLRYTICLQTGWFVPRFGHPQGQPHSSRGIGLHSIQGDRPEALWVFQSYDMGLTQRSSSMSKRVC